MQMMVSVVQLFLIRDLEFSMRFRSDTGVYVDDNIAEKQLQNWLQLQVHR